MASTQRSNIEVFFRVIGANRVKKAFKDLEAAAGRSALGTAGALGRAPGRAAGSAVDLTRTIGARSLSAATSLVRNLGGIAPAISLGYRASTALFGGLRNATTQAVALGVAAYGIGKAFESVHDANAELTSVVLALRAVNQEVEAARGMPLFKSDTKGTGLADIMSGGAKESARDLQFLNKVAHEHGVSVRELGKDYATLKASSTGSAVDMNDVKVLTEGIADAALVLGRSTPEIHRANIALGQIASKGQVYAEELKGQLAEAIPGALPIVARAYGISVRELNKLVEQGLVDSATFFKKFGQQLKREYGSAAKAAAQTTRVAAGQLANAWFNAKVAIGSGDLDKMFMRILKAATKLFDTLKQNGAMSRFGSNLARAMQPLVERFERATNGGYDFERVLNALVSTFRALVGAIRLTLDVFGRFMAGVRNMREVFGQYGLALPSISNGIRKIFDGFVSFTDAVRTRTLSGGPYVDFFASLYVLIESCVYAVGRMLAPRIGPGVRTMAEVFRSMTQWLIQAAAAMFSLADGSISLLLNDTGQGILVNLIHAVDVARQLLHWLDQARLAMVSLMTGKASPELDDTGQDILVNLVQAFDTVRQFKAGVKEVYALLSGRDAPKDAPLDVQKRFAARDKIVDLAMGRSNEAKADALGNELISEDTFEVAFKFRDMIVKLVEFLDNNRDTLREFFNGAIDVMKGVLTVGYGIATVLDFVGINSSVGYLLGMWYMLSKILPMGLIFSGIWTAISATVSFIVAKIGLMAAGMGIATGMLVARFGVIVAIVAGIAFIIAKIVANWRLMKDEIGSIGKLLKAGIQNALANFLRSIADLLVKIPGIGGWLRDKANTAADNYDMFAAQNRSQARADSLAATARRKRDNGGKDPFDNGAKDAFDLDALGTGFSEMMGDGLSLAMRSGGVTGAASNLGVAIAQGMSSDETLSQIAELNAQKSESLSGFNRQLADAYSGNDPIGDHARGTGAYSRPVVIMLSEGGQVELRGRADDPTLDNLAARTAKNRTGASPGWSQ